MVEHELKTWPEPYEDNHCGDTSYEVRKADRVFNVGDTAYLREYHPPRNGFPGYFTGREMKRKITHIRVGGMFGVDTGFCILSLGPIFWEITK